MKKNMNEWFRGKGFYISLMAGAICVVAVAAVTLDSFGINKNMSGEKEGNDMAKNILEEYEPEIEEETATPEVPTPVPTQETEEVASKVTEEPTKKTEVKQKKNRKKNKTQNAQNEMSPKVAVANNGEDVASLTFDQDAGIAWPVQGEIIMKYSADNVIFHKTLGQYKSNPALVISASEGANVSCSVDSIVTKVGENEEIGNFVEVSIGDGYKMTYGGLENVQVKKGDAVKRGELLGMVAAPTKYYIDEGSNVYLKMTCKDEPVDPMIFLE